MAGPPVASTVMAFMLAVLAYDGVAIAAHGERCLDTHRLWAFERHAVVDLMVLGVGGRGTHA